MEKYKLEKIRGFYIAPMVLLAVLILITSRMAVSMAKTGASNPLKIESSGDLEKLSHGRCVYFEDSQIFLSAYGVGAFINDIPLDAYTTNFAYARLNDGGLMIITLSGFTPLNFDDITERWFKSSYGYVMDSIGNDAQAIENMVRDFSQHNYISLKDAREELHAAYYINTIKQKPKKLFIPTLTITIIFSVLFLMCMLFYINPKLTRGYRRLIKQEEMKAEKQSKSKENIPWEL